MGEGFLSAFWFWLIGLKRQWACLIINHKLCTICLWTHSDGAHGDIPSPTYPPISTLPSPTHPYPTYPYLPSPTLPAPTPIPTYPNPPLHLPTLPILPYLPPPTPTTTYPHPPLPLPSPSHIANPVSIPHSYTPYPWNFSRWKCLKTALYLL